MDECIDALGESHIVSTFDANGGYWQVEIDDIDREKTIFTSHHGLYQFLRMQFGLKNSPVFFQKRMDVIYSSMKLQSAFIYKDYIVVFSKNVEQHLHDRQRFLKLLRDACVSLNIRKRSILSETTNYLGHVIRPGIIEIAEATTVAIPYLQDLANQIKINSFLGLCNVFQRFMPNLSPLATPLYKKLCKDQTMSFRSLTDEERKAVKRLKDLLKSLMVLALHRLTLHYTIDSKSCDTQNVCVLLHEQPHRHARQIEYLV